MKKVNSADALIKAYGKLFADICDEENNMAYPTSAPIYAPITGSKKRGRPKKGGDVVAGYPTVMVSVMANGYTITVGDKGAEDTFVFGNKDEMTDWLKKNLTPTFKTQKFLKAL